MGLACMRGICHMENHPGPRLPVFLIPFSLQPLLTLGTKQLCAEGFSAQAAKTVPFVMAWERKTGEAGWTSARVNHSCHVAGPAAAAARGHTRALGEHDLSPRLEAGEPAAGCPALNQTARERTGNGLGVGESLAQKGP